MAGEEIADHCERLGRSMMSPIGPKIGATEQNEFLEGGKDFLRNMIERKRNNILETSN